MARSNFHQLWDAAVSSGQLNWPGHLTTIQCIMNILNKSTKEDKTWRMYIH